jgi:hypothetical protein
MPRVVQPSNVVKRLRRATTIKAYETSTPLRCLEITTPMRVRPQRSTHRRPLTARRPHLAEAPTPPAPGPADSNLAAERRHRASVAPEDTAHYGCGCGFQFEAPVSTTVACPHCGCAQAW